MPYIDVDFNDLNMEEEIDVLPTIFDAFSPKNQKLMFDIYRELDRTKGTNYIQQFKFFYERYYNEEFVMPSFASSDDMIYNLSEFFQNFEEALYVHDNSIVPLSCSIVDIPQRKGNKGKLQIIEDNGMILDLVEYSKKGSKKKQGYVHKSSLDEVPERLNKGQMEIDVAERNQPSSSLVVLSEAPQNVKETQPSSSIVLSEAPRNISKTKPYRGALQSPVKKRNIRSSPYNLRSVVRNDSSGVVQPSVEEAISTEPMDIDNAVDTGRRIALSFAKYESNAKVLLCKNKYICLYEERSKEMMFVAADEGSVLAEFRCTSTIVKAALLKGFLRHRSEIGDPWQDTGQLAIC